MAFSEKIRLVIDVTTGNASSQLGRLKTDLGNAEGGFEKLKVAGGGAFDFMKQNVAVFAAAAGAAVLGFATDSVAQFQNVALGAGELRDALGVTAEEASRLQEVAGDLGIPVDALASTIGRMNRAASDTPEAFEGIGAAIARNADGTTNVTQTFLNAAEALRQIPDAADRAAAGQKIFGRGWQSISELIMQGADGIKEAMASVEGGKIIDDSQIDDARRFRDAVDALKGNVEELSVTVGGHLVPALADAAETIQDVKTAAQQLGDSLPDLPGWLQDVREKVDGFPLLPHDQITTGIGGITDAIGDMRDELGAAVEGSIDPMLGLLVNASDSATRSYIAQGEAAAEAAEAAADLAPELDSATRSYIAQGEAIIEAAEAAAAHEEAVKANTDAVAEHRSELERLAEIEQEAADRIQEAADARRAAADSQYALNDAQRSFAEQLVTANETLANSEGTMTDVAAAMDDTARAAGSVADAAVRLAEEQAVASGTALSASESAQVWRGAMMDQAAAASGPLRDAILGYIAAVDDIPPEKLSQIRALIDEGKLAEANRLLNNAARTRTAIIRTRLVSSSGQPVYETESGARFEHTGGSSPAGFTNIAGERGLEFAGRSAVLGAQVVPSGTQVTSTRTTAAMVDELIGELRAARVNGGGGAIDMGALAAAVERGAERGSYRAGIANGKEIASALRAGTRF